MLPFKECLYKHECLQVVRNPSCSFVFPSSSIKGIVSCPVQVNWCFSVCGQTVPKCLDALKLKNQIFNVLFISCYFQCEPFSESNMYLNSFYNYLGNFEDEIRFFLQSVSNKLFAISGNLSSK